MRRAVHVFLLAVIFGLMGSPQALASPQVEAVKWRDLSAWLVRDNTLPLIHIEMSWRGGTVRESHAGLTMLMARLMNEGASDMDAQAFQQAMADKAISLSFSAGADHVTARLQCLSRFRAACFRLLRQALLTPRFDMDAIARMKDEQKTALRRAQQNPSRLAAQRLAAMAYGEHAYGRDKNGTFDSLDAIPRSAIQQRHERVFARDNLQLAIVGDMSRAEARRFMRDVFGELPRHSPLAAHPKPRRAQGPKTEHIPRAGPQTSIAFGHHGIGYDHALFFPAFVMNSILGGSGFSSRLTEEVREARGLAYSVYSYWSIRAQAGLWRGGVASDNKTAQQAMDVIRGEMRHMRDKGVSAARLEAAKTYLTGAYALRFDSGKKIAGQLIGLQQAGRDLSYFTTRNQAIEAVSQDDIKAAAALLLADELLLVSVGETPVALAPLP